MMWRGAGLRWLADGALVAKFLELTDVVQNRGRQQQSRRAPGSGQRFASEAAQADDVLEQAAEISVVHAPSPRERVVFRGDGGSEMMEVVSSFSQGFAISPHIQKLA